MKAKENLKKILRSEIVYTDGLRPDEISNIVANVRDVDIAIENDLEQ